MRCADWRVLSLLVPLLLAAPLHGQTNGSVPPGAARPNGGSASNGNGTPTDSAALLLARADSARAQLVQPPGSYGGVRAMDLIRVPFQLFGATLSLGLYGAGAAYMLADKVVIEPAEKAQARLEEWDIEARADAFGNRSWPGLVLRYQGAPPFYAEAGYTLRQYEHYEAGVELGDESTGGLAMGQFRRMRQPHFWGIGPDAPDEDRSDYAYDAGTVGVSGWWTPRVVPLRLSGGVAWETNRAVGRGWDSSRPNTNEVFEASELFGLDDRTEYLRIDGGVALDRTHVEHLQVRGFSVAGEWQYFDGVGGTPSTFHRLAGDARFFVPANERQLMALRLIAEDHVGESGMAVPFTHLARLGDDRGLRGYSGRRFRDRALLAAQLEWRYEVYWHPGYPNVRAEGFAFADAGAVGPALSSIGWSDFHATPGIGVRWVQDGDAKIEVFLSHGERWRGGIGLSRTF